MNVPTNHRTEEESPCQPDGSHSQRRANPLWWHIVRHDSKANDPDRSSRESLQAARNNQNRERARKSKKRCRRSQSDKSEDKGEFSRRTLIGEIPEQRYIL